MPDDILSMELLLPTAIILFPDIAIASAFGCRGLTVIISPLYKIKSGFSL